MEQDIYISQIHLDRMALRQAVTPESVAQLADSIKQQGLLQSIVVAPREGGGWRLIAGRRRLEAAKLLGWTTIPARIIETNQIDEIPALAENLMRLNMNPVEEAEALARLHYDRGLSIAQLAELTNHSQSWVQDRLFLHTLPENFKQAVADRKLSIGAAGQLMQIADEDYRNYLLSVALINGATVHQCQAWLLDYQARSRIMNPTGDQPIAPRLPIEPPDPVTTCSFCQETHKVTATNLIRLCHECYATLHEVRKHLTTGDQPDPSPKTPVTDESKPHF